MNCNRNATVDGLRYVCNILVVVLHAGMFPISVPGSTECAILSTISDAAWWLSIPVLFVISGWCCFNGFEHVTFQWWVGKLSNRWWRLLVPFLLWGAIFTALYCLLGSVSSRVAERLIEHRVTEIAGYVRMVFNFNDYILYGPLWFLRALFVCALISPIIGHVLAVGRRTCWHRMMSLGLICLGGYAIGYVLHENDWVVCPGYGFACFGVGAWLAGNEVWMLRFGECRVLRLFKAIGNSRWCQKWLLPTGMFVYVTHLFVNRIVQYSLCGCIYRGAGQFGLLFIVSFTVSVVSPIVIWHLMNRCCPWLLALLDGRGYRQVILKNGKG